MYPGSVQAPFTPSETSDRSTKLRKIMLVWLVVASSLLLGLTLWQNATGIALVGERVLSFVEGFAPWRGPVRVGLQVGHLNASEHPEELARLRVNTGGHWEGLNEVDVNLAVAEQLKTSLELGGIAVDLLPATVPPGYRADLVVSLHTDASPDEGRRGYKSAHLREARNRDEPVLKSYLDTAYLYYSGLPDDHNNVSGSMLDYYAFNRAQFRHTVSRGTPAVLVELGYLSNPEDRAFLSDPVNPAYALKRGIVSYLESQGRLPAPP